MADAAPIPIPFRRRFARLRSVYGPPMVFIACAAAALILWSRHTGVTAIPGKVHAVRFEVATLAEGRLMPLTSGEIEPFMLVNEGQIIARLDDRPTLSAVATLQAQLAVNRAQLRSQRVLILQERRDLERDQHLTLQRLTLEVEERRLDVLDRRAATAVHRIELRRLEEELNQIKSMVEQGAETAYTLVIATLRRDALAQRIEEDERSLARAEADAEAAERRLAALPQEEAAEMDEVLEPLRAAVTLVERQLDEHMLRIEALEVRAPIAGMIAKVHLRPGEVATPDTPIVTLADPVATHIVAYLPERSPMRVEPGQAVRVRVPGRPSDESKPLPARITDVGVQVALLPEHLRRDPTRPEWGLPVRIELPPGLAARPGELVQVIGLR